MELTKSIQIVTSISLLKLILSDINDPVSDVSQSTPASVDQSKIDTLVTFGFSEEVARNALMATVLVFFFVLE